MCRDRYALFARKYRHRLPQLLGDERHHGVREAQRRFQHADKRSPRTALCRFVSRLQLRLRELDVPVAVFIPYEFVYGLGSEIETIGIQMLDDIAFGMLQP